VIDWETAGAGSGQLRSGEPQLRQVDQAAKRHALQAAYFEAYQAERDRRWTGRGFLSRPRPVVLYQSLKWLAWWGHHRRLSHKFSNFMKELGTVFSKNIRHRV